MAVPPPMTIYGFAHHFCPKSSGYRAETSLSCCPHGQDRPRRFSAFSRVFSPRNPLFPLGLEQRSFAFLWQTTRISLCQYLFCRGFSFSRKPIVPSARNPIVSRPWSIVSRSSRELLFVLLPPSSVLK